MTTFTLAFIAALLLANFAAAGAGLWLVLVFIDRLQRP